MAKARIVLHVYLPLTEMTANTRAMQTKALETVSMLLRKSISHIVCLGNLDDLPRARFADLYESAWNCHRYDKS